MTTDRLRQIRERLARVPKLYATDDGKDAEWRADDDGCYTTISNDPSRLGWENDSGCYGYGLPRQVAEDLAALRDDVEWLMRQIPQDPPEYETCVTDSQGRILARCPDCKREHLLPPIKL